MRQHDTLASDADALRWLARQLAWERQLQSLRAHAYATPVEDASPRDRVREKAA